MWAAWGLDVDTWLVAVPTVPFSRPAGAGISKLGTTCRRREIKTMYLPTLNVKKCLHPLSSSVSDPRPRQLPSTALTGLSGILGEKLTPRGLWGRPGSLPSKSKDSQQGPRSPGTCTLPTPGLRTFQMGGGDREKALGDAVHGTREH